MRPNHYRFIDGFRAVGMIMVFMHHTSKEFLTSANSNMFFYLYKSIGKVGYIGVYIFFIVSGFLITGVLIKGYAKQLDISRFYMHRFLKIIPVFFFIFIFMSVLLKIFHLYPDENVRRYGNTLLFLFNTRYTLAFVHLWSLRIETLYYLFYPLILCMVFFHLKKPKNRRLLLIGLGFLVMAISIVIRHSKIGMPILADLDSLAIGCILKLTEPYYSRNRDPKHFLTGGGVLGIILILYSLFLWGWDEQLGLCIFVVLFFFLSYFKVLYINRFFDNSLIRSLGKISYAVYLVHYPLSRIFLSNMTYFPSNCLSLSLLAVMTIFLGAVMTNTVEKYFLSLKKYIK